MSVISTLRDRATTTPSDEAFVFMDYDTKTGDQIDRMTWSQLYSRVTAVSAYLISYGRHADRRRTAAISAPQGLDYVAGFLGALCAGWTPVPLPEPLGSLRDKRTGLAVLDCAADVVLTTSQAETRVRATIATHGASVTTPVIALDTLDEPSGDNCDLDSQLSDWSSYLQYTSGSTANPRGVVLSMRNVTENVDQIIRNYFRHEGGAPRLPSSVVSWLPLYHDMGLMVGLFIPLFVGCPVILTSPEAFIRKPARWMQLLAKHQAPFSAAPNFAFDLAVAKTSEEDMAGLDLGHVNTIINGAEQVQPNTITKFLRRFRPYNLMPAAVKPSYGMAEAVVYLATTKAGSPPTSTEFDADSLARGHAELSTFETERATRLIRYHSDDKEPLLRIVDPDSNIELGPGRIGEIWIHGKNVSTGYHNADDALNRDKFEASIREASAGTPRSPWLRTGDLGFIVGDEFYIVGRMKDLIIQDGVNHYPDDIETTVKEFTGGRVAAFSVSDDGVEHLVIAAEVRTEHGPDKVTIMDFSTIKRLVVSALSKLHGLHVTDFLLVPPGALPKTTSGKISRAACAKQYGANKLQRVATFP